MYKRKTETEYRIEGQFAAGWEEVTCETSFRAGRDALRAYRENDNQTAYRLRRVRVRIDTGEPMTRRRKAPAT